MTTTTNTQRAYDIVVFGATGFTGRLTAEYLATCKQAGQFRWAIAGRSLTKLEETRQALQKLAPQSSPGVIVCNVNEPESLATLARQTRVVITTVGPYLNYGEPLVKACIDAGTHYVDLTGEPEFVESLMHGYDDQARKMQTKIVNCCGFDSIPHDLGALFTINALNKMLGADAGKVPVTLEGYVTASGTFSGGTWHSAITQMARMKNYYQKRKTWVKARRSKTNDSRKIRTLAPRISHVKAFDAYACSFPTIDPQVVCRSAETYPKYGPEFRYGHNVLVKHPAKLAGGLAAVGGIFALSQLKLTRDLLLKLRDPGQGPDAAERAKSWFKVKFIGQAKGLHVWTQVSGGDPGYGETAKMLAESALCLALDADKLPPNFGVVTPAAAMGERLIERLQTAGIEFEVL